MLQNVLSTPSGIRTSLFIETDQAQIEAAAAVGADRIELYTESFAVQHARIGREAASSRLPKLQDGRTTRVSASTPVMTSTLQNLRDFAESVPHLDEVSIGHALISDALYLGMSNAVAQYRACLRPVMIPHARHLPPPKSTKHPTCSSFTACLGSSDNWQTLGKRYAASHQVWMLDARNHGKSPP